jgi:hypothetical protein
MSSLRSLRLSQVSFRVGNLFKTPIADYDVILLCLVPAMLPEIEQLLISAKKGTVVLSARFPLPSHVPLMEIEGGPTNGVYVYKI